MSGNEYANWHEPGAEHEAATTPERVMGVGWISMTGGGGGEDGGGGAPGGTGGGGAEGGGGDGGGGEGGGAGGGEGRRRMPQSSQSLPTGQMAYSAPAPPSSQIPSFTQPWPGHVLVHSSGGLGGGGGDGGGLAGSGGGLGGTGGDGGIEGVGGGARGVVTAMQSKPIG